ncbi:MAG TPA: tRNA (adenosine(37)-N6)-threonylcarbamoyltransferase complex ATPase subunit type 1 TsaE [Burkholderiales bacterium]|nr:tRNA (adenosine(37)-N6)-threonylcarbamoyltransferase complex ATPase subunit type 1 TsaE [Burkholderiales bacterium]
MNATAARRSVFLADETATLAWGAALAKRLVPGMLVTLSGELGSGKTTLARGVLRGLGYEGRVKSPTYTLVELYNLSKLDLYHFDFYRFNEAGEWRDAGFRDYFGTQGVCLVEWPERVAQFLPRADLEITMTIEGEGRRLQAVAETEQGKRCLDQLPD